MAHALDGYEQLDLRYKPAGPVVRSFHLNGDRRRLLMGPVGCVSGETRIVTDRGPRTIDSLTEPTRVLSWNERTNQFQLSQSSGGFPKGRDCLYRVTTPLGVWRAAGRHLVLCSDRKYRRVESLREGDLVAECDPHLEATCFSSCLKWSPLNDLSCWQRREGFWDHYEESARRYDQPPHQARGNGPAPFQQHDDARRSPQSSWPEGDPSEIVLERNHQDLCDAPLQIDGSSSLASILLSGVVGLGTSEPCSHNVWSDRQDQRSEMSSLFHRTEQQSSSYSRSLPYSFGYRPILSITREDQESTYWDMQVSDTHNYVTEDGCIHHNSGKSVAGCWEVIRRGFAMPVCRDGIRRGRYAVVRNTFGDLERTTIKTWNDQFSSAFGEPVSRKAGIVHEIQRNLTDGTRIELEVMFFSMDRPDDVKRLLSYEISGAFVNEAREMPKQIFEALDDRVTRYPSKAMLPDGVVPFFGWWADTNPPDKDNWIYDTFEVMKPDEWVMFRQPGGLVWNGYDWVANPRAENLQNLTLGARYYTDAKSGKGEDHIRVYYGAEYGYVKEGRLIIGEFSEQFHSSDIDLQYDENIETVYVGLDFGATPAAGLSQLHPDGQWRTITELQSAKTGMQSFANDILKPHLLELKSRGHRFVITGDPANGTSETDGRTPFMVLKEAGIDCEPAHTNAFEKRMEILRGLCREQVEGKPKFLLSRQCKTARRGLAQKFVYKRVGVPTDEGQKYQTKPDKNEFSHTIDAIIYGIMGSGLGSELGSGRGKTGKISYPKMN